MRRMWRGHFWRRANRVAVCRSGQEPRANSSLELHSLRSLEDDQVMASQNSFITRTRLTAAGSGFDFFSLPALERAGYGGVARLPYSLKILLENLLRCEDGRFVHADHIQTLASWDVTSGTQKEIAFTPPRDRKSTRLNSSH